MATSYSVMVIGPEPGSPVAAKLQADISAAIAKIESSMSIFEPESDISRFNTSLSKDWFRVAEETADVVGIALEISRETGGAFDITVGPAVELWGFGVEKQSGLIPPAGTVLKNEPLIDYRKLQVRPFPPALRKQLPDVRLDLSGIAKGYAADKVSMIIDEYNFDRYVVEIGGEIRTAGLNINDTPWQIGIAAPAASKLDPVIYLTDASVATSGDYRNYFESGKRRYSHIMDPETGAPTGHEGLSVTVVGNECARMDALATALAVFGPEKGYNLALEKGWAVYFIFRGETEWRQRFTPAFKSFFTPTGQNMKRTSAIESK